MKVKTDNREKVYSQAYKKWVLDIFDRAIREPGEDVKYFTMPESIKDSIFGLCRPVSKNALDNAMSFLIMREQAVKDIMNKTYQGKSSADIEEERKKIFREIAAMEDEDDKVDAIMTRGEELMRNIARLSFIESFGDTFIEYYITLIASRMTDRGYTLEQAADLLTEGDKDLLLNSSKTWVEACSAQYVLAVLREEGLKNPMTDEEIDDFIATVRKERKKGDK